MLERKDDKGVYRLIYVALFQVLRYYRYGAGAGAAGGAGDEQEGICLRELSAGPDGLDNLVTIFPGYLRSKLIYLADAVAAGLAASDENPVLVVGFYLG